MSFVSLAMGQHWGNHSVGPRALHEALIPACCTPTIHHHSFFTDRSFLWSYLFVSLFHATFLLISL